MKRRIIAVDIDDVLSASAAGLADFSNKRWHSNIKAEDYSEDWGLFWGISREEAIKRAQALLPELPDLMQSFAHFEEAVPVLQQLSRKYRLVVVTSRDATLKPVSRAWIERHFPEIFDQIHHASIWDDRSNIDHSLKATKTELCQQIGASYLIDDQLKHCLGAARAGIQTLLFGSYKWNRSDQALPQGVARVVSWAEVARYFDV